ncbi:MAG TPA: cyclic nucleotide-binding domain-containing protein [Candidatus Hydrogenedentes bacterium]|nr:cyclic nucleotide-binding domain-containing protein [Candidatus Hydrogenedentota bacterium]
MLWRKKDHTPDKGEEPSPPDRTSSLPTGSAPTDSGSGGASPASPSQPLSLDALPRMLFQQGKVGRDAIKRAMLLQRETGEFIGDILVREGLIDEDSLLTFLSRNCRIPHVSILNYVIDESLLRLVPPDVCRKHRVLPLDRIGRNLTVAMVNPLDGAAHHALRECCPDVRIKPILCSSAQFEEVARRFLEGEKKKNVIPTYIRRLSAEGSVGSGPGVDASIEESPDVSPAASLSDTASLPPLSGEARAVLEQAGEISPPEGAAEILSTVFTPHEEEDEEIGEDLGRLADTPEPDAEDLNATAQRLAHVLVDSMRNAYGVLARRLELLRGIPPQEVARIFAMGKVHEYQPGQVIFEKGAPGESVFAILTGQVEVMDGDRRLALLGQGETVGEMALADERCRSASVRAVEQTALLEFTLEDIRGRFDPAVSIQLLLNVITILSARLYQANRRRLAAGSGE